MILIFLGKQSPILPGANRFSCHAEWRSCRTIDPDDFSPVKNGSIFLKFYDATITGICRYGIGFTYLIHLFTGETYRLYKCITDGHLEGPFLM